MSPLVSALHLSDIANVKGVASDLSHCITPSQVLDFTGIASGKPSVSVTDEEVEELMTQRVRGSKMMELKSWRRRQVQNQLRCGYAAARFVESSLRALDGDVDVYECSYVQSELASRVKLGKKGIEAASSSDVQEITEYEAKALEAHKPKLKGSIEKGIAFAKKQSVTA